MTLEVLISSVNCNPKELLEQMNITGDAILINQCGINDYQEIATRNGKVKCYSFAEKGVGLSRNNALLRASSDIVLFADDDIRYVENYEALIIKAFEDNPKADMIMFNMDVCEERSTYHTTKKTKICLLNSGRYPTYSIACKRDILHKKGITFSLLFGGGARYGCGEDSLFIRSCLKNHVKMLALPITIGREEVRESTWFKGYNEKYFFDKGVLFRYLYGGGAILFAIRFVLTKKSFLCKEVAPKRAFSLILDGMREAKK